MRTKPLTYQHQVEDRAREIQRTARPAISRDDARRQAIAEIYTLRSGDRVADLTGTRDHDGTVIEPAAGWVTGPGESVVLVAVRWDNAAMIGADPSPGLVRRDNLRLLPGQR